VRGDQRALGRARLDRVDAVRELALLHRAAAAGGEQQCYERG
jgi:hypothetical protein